MVFGVPQGKGGGVDEVEAVKHGSARELCDVAVCLALLCIGGASMHEVGSVLGGAATAASGCTTPDLRCSAVQCSPPPYIVPSDHHHTWY